MDSFILSCPICRLNTAQIAPGVYQCGRCGYGPSTHGHRGYFCFADIEFDGDQIRALCFRFKSKREGYIVSALTWRVDENGKSVFGLKEEHLGYETNPENFPNLPLPLVVLSPEKWDMPPNTPGLIDRMFFHPLGEKLRVLSIGQPGKSGARPFLIEPTARFQVSES